MIVFIIESLLAIVSIIYYALSRRAEWLILVGLVIVMMAVERLIVAVQNLIPEDVIEVDADALEWTRTDKALPPEPVGDECLEYNVMIAGAERSTTLEYHGANVWLEPHDGGVSYAVTHWREMPKVPEEVKDEQSNLNT